LCQDYSTFEAADTKILVIGPEDQGNFKSYWVKEKIPFTGIPDPDLKILNLYNQKVNLMKFGRMPAQMIIDKNGLIRHIHYGNSMMDIPSNSKILKLLKDINKES
jgi:peroxiredoxin Q/BCP